MRTSRARDQRVIRSSDRMNGAHIAPENATVKNFHHVATAPLSEYRPLDFNAGARCLDASGACPGRPED